MDGVLRYLTRDARALGIAGVALGTSALTQGAFAVVWIVGLRRWSAAGTPEPTPAYLAQVATCLTWRPVMLIWLGICLIGLSVAVATSIRQARGAPPYWTWPAPSQPADPTPKRAAPALRASAVALMVGIVLGVFGCSQLVCRAVAEPAAQLVALSAGDPSRQAMLERAQRDLGASLVDAIVWVIAGCALCCARYRPFARARGGEGNAGDCPA